MRVFVTGGTGYVGTGVLASLVRAEHEVVALVRQASRLDVGGVTQVVEGDVLESQTYQEALQGCDACIHLVGLLREAPERGVTFEKLNYEATVAVLRACGRAGVKRFLHMSANGAERAIKTGYMITKAKAEEAVRASGLDWTIFRPTVIYGGREDRPSFVQMLEGHLKTLPLLPYFGDGRYRLAPVSLDEVSESFQLALTDPDAVGKTYHLCGNEEYAYKDLLRRLRDLAGFHCKVFPFPYWLMKGAASLLGGFAWFPVTEGQLRMLREGNVCPQGAATQDDLGVPRRSFDAWLHWRAGELLPPKPDQPLLESPSMTITRNLDEN